jgi:hypothetical protein
MQIAITPADNVLTIFEARCHQVGEGLARRAFSMAMNKEGRKSFTAVKRALVQQTSIKMSMVAASTKFVSAGPNRLETRIDGSGSAIPLIQFSPSAGPVGVSATVWGRRQTYPHTFFAYGQSGVFKRLSPKRFPIQTVYGPAIPVELVKDESLATFEEGVGNIVAEVDRLLPLLLSGMVR